MRFPLKLLLAGLALLVLNPLLHAQVSFAPATNYVVVSGFAPGVPISVAAADVNGDGKADLVCANFMNNNLSVLTNKGSGSLGSNATYAVASSPRFVVAADINGDGKPDLICSLSPANKIIVLTNNGTGILGSNAIYTVGDNPTSVVAADINVDGKADLICANWGATGDGNTLSVLTNNGTGGFGSNATLVVGPAPQGPSSVTAADVNGDAKLDLICANTRSNSLSIFTNDGSGNFVLSSSPMVGRGPFSVNSADVNGDGKIDLISANPTDNTLSILTNDGSGGFALSSSPSVGAIPRSVAVADVNGDGNVDLISANYNDNTLSVLTNDGSGGFVLAALPGVGSNPDSPVTADINGDGRLDLISANYGNGNGNTLSVVINTSTFLPLLTLNHSSNKVMVSWASQWTGWAGWTLQQNTNLNTTSWTSFSGTIGDDGTTKTVTNSPTTGNLFFRLTHP